jgi:hypothetical protein
MTREELFSKFWAFYFIKHGRCYPDACEEIRNLDMTELDVVPYMLDERVHIKLRRPGILIGAKGDNINKLTEFLGMKIHIEEEPTATIADRLIPWDGELIDDFF